jgi:hypothetical protein
MGELEQEHRASLLYSTRALLRFRVTGSLDSQRLQKTFPVFFCDTVYGDVPANYAI